MTITTEQLEARAVALGLGFFIEDRSGIPVKQWVPESNGCTPATAAEVAMWELLAAREAVPVGFIERSGLDYLQSGADADIWPDGGVGDIPLYTAPPAPAVSDGYCIMPVALTAENGAKGALSGEFKVSRTVTCNECGCVGCDDCAYAGEFEEEITVPWDTIKDIYRAAVDACRAAAMNGTAPPAPAVPPEITDGHQEDVAMGDKWADSFRAGWNACRAAMLAAAPEVKP